MAESNNIGIRSIVLERINARDRRGFSLRMAPMIDMIFLLLIFFLVAAKWRPQEDFLPFRLPAASAQEPVLGRTEPLQLHISATANGSTVQIGQFQAVQLSDDTFEENLTGLMEEMERIMHLQKRIATDPVEIICERQVSWEHVAKIYNLLYSAGLSDMTFQMTE